MADYRETGIVHADEAWSIYYADGSVVDGVSRVDWEAAPVDGVQAVVVWRSPSGGEAASWSLGMIATIAGPNGRRISDRMVWTGVDEYQTLRGWGVKCGAWMRDDDYRTLMDKVFRGDRRTSCLS